MDVFRELDCHVVAVFQRCEVFKMTSKMAGNRMFFAAMIHCTEKIIDTYIS